MIAELKERFKEYRSRIAFVVTAVLLVLFAGGLAIYWWKSQLRAFLQLDPLLVPLVGKVAGGLAVAIGGGFALWRWTVDQRWRRVQYTYELVEKFLSKDNTKLALRMLDVTGEMELPAEDDGSDPRTVIIAEKILINSLLTLRQQRIFDEPEFSIRMIFDEFFTDLSTFQHHIEAKLIKLDDVRPYLEYWIKSINGYGSIYSIKLARQINAFLKAFNFDAVLELSKSMNYPFKEARLDPKPLQMNGGYPDLLEHCRTDRGQWKEELYAKPKADRDVEIEYKIYSQVDNFVSVIRVDSAYARDDGRANTDFKTILWDTTLKKPVSVSDFFDENLERRSLLQGLLEKHIIASLKEKKIEIGLEDNSGVNRYWGIEQGVFNVGAVTLAPSDEEKKCAGLIFHYPRRVVGTYQEGEFEVFVPWDIFHSFLNKEVQSFFGGQWPLGRHAEQ